MKKNNSFEIFKSYFSKATGETKKSSVIIEPFITISRETGSGGVSLGENLVKYLNIFDTRRKKDWVLFDKNLLNELTSDSVLTSQIEKYIEEKRVSEFQSLLEQIFGLHPSLQNVAHKISRTILHMALLGNCIIVGRGANIITKTLKQGLHIRLIDSMEKKINYIQEILKIDKVQAIKHIEKEDRDRKEYVKKNFSKDISDPSSYSMVINLVRIDTRNAVRLISDEAMNLRFFN